MKLIITQLSIRFIVRRLIINFVSQPVLVITCTKIDLFWLLIHPEIFIDSAPLATFRLLLEGDFHDSGVETRGKRKHRRTARRHGVMKPKRSIISAYNFLRFFRRIACALRGIFRVDGANSPHDDDDGEDDVDGRKLDVVRSHVRLCSRYFMPLVSITVH